MARDGRTGADRRREAGGDTRYGIGVTVYVSGLELISNAKREQMFNLIEERIRVARRSLKSRAREVLGGGH